ncbi:hypothetical protein SAMN05444000_10368 [Shimia gijangensis]|uniref:Uncharacterized protein n=1 Tax=Shimia gijangensis TaxID=1470563 RepID=A0A1M6E130_9RHOB|nr:hypothetical protein [Shimia gijangensis]SHI78978.1 hypothetical protein SAMN05444000_10368 [Shimia gijangensis]
MVTNNEVLTVSYGTFSCTLEGFDDSFDTMKAIAEYFRDLAADDRYFGAEPPTPDAEMLARIAEREIERRVQARTEHGAIVLSTGAMATQPTISQDAAEAPGDVDESAADPLPQDTASLTDEAVVESAADMNADIEESQAGDEMVLEAEPVVDAADILDEVEPEFVDVTDAVLDAVTAPDFDDSVPAASDIEDSVVAEAVIEEMATTVEDDVTEVEAETPEVDDVEETIAEPSEDSDVLAAMMSRVENDQDVAEDITEIDLAELEADREDTLISEIVEAETIGETTIINLADAEELSTDEDQDSVETAEEIFEDEAPEAPAVDENSIAAKLQRIRAVVSKSADQPEEEDFIEDEHADNMIDEPAAEAPSVLTLDGQMAAAAMAEDARAAQDDEEDDAGDIDTVGDHSQPVRARVIRMKKSDFEAAVDTGLLEAVAVDDDEDDDEFDADPESSLSAEEEAELLAELAQVEAELNDADEAADDEPVEAIGADFSDEFEAERPTRGQHLTEVSTKTDADMSRLMNEAQNQLNEPGGSRRRQAIAHLRAAVAATKAEKSAGVPDKVDDAAEAYRDDLASVVRPVPSTAGAAPEHQSKQERPRDPSPLKLVAEQRVDAPVETPKEASAPAEEAPRVPVRPRRVSAVDTVDRNKFVDQTALGSIEAGDFNEFAESVGAHQLHEILEAAAAYLTFVEGHDVFSRPMVMRMVLGLEEAEFTREDSLRGFGQLLRENKIEKVSGGRFTASEEIGFRPEDRAAG